jgi:hypothetical protein
LRLPPKPSGAPRANSAARTPRCSKLSLPANARLEIAAQGGHCGFLLGTRMDGFAEAWVAQRLAPRTD